MENIFIHVLEKNRLNIEQFEVELKLMEEIYKKYNIKNIILYKGEEIELSNFVSVLCENIGVKLIVYKDESELIRKVKNLAKINSILFIYTATEFLIDEVNTVKQELGMCMSENVNIFRDKSLQRKIIQENNPEIGIKFIKTTLRSLDIEKIENFIGYPFIIKPIAGQQSSGVWKIKSRVNFEEYKQKSVSFQQKLKDRGVMSEEIIVEEFIDGNMYSIDYFISEEGKISFTYPVKVELGVDFGIDDFCNVSRFCSEKILEELDFSDVKQFVQETVKASRIKNTFVHHEFKFTTKGQLKTIEINGRIGGGRVGLIGESYKTNLFEMVISPKYYIGKLQEQNCIFYIYPMKRGILKSFNNDLLEEIKGLDSFEKLDVSKKFLGKEIGLTKDGFTKVGRIKYKNTNEEQFQKDYNFIKAKYKDLLILE